MDIAANVSLVMLESNVKLVKCCNLTRLLLCSDNLNYIIPLIISKVRGLLSLSLYFFRRFLIIFLIFDGENTENLYVSFEFSYIDQLGNTLASCTFAARLGLTTSWGYIRVGHTWDFTVVLRTE